MTSREGHFGMPTVHEQGVQELLDRMLDHPGASRTLAETRRRFKLPSGHPNAFDEDYAAAIGQIFRSSPSIWPMEQVAAFVAVHTKICAGEILQVLISAEGMDGGPLADSRRSDNEAKLRYLPVPFQAKVDLQQHGADYDGTLKWDQAIKMDGASGCVFIDNCCNAVKQPISTISTVAPGWAPLEIGATTPSRTLLHLLQEGAVARWPYGADHIRLLVHRNGPVVVRIP
ncbi:hypothetical protein ACWENQ_08395 [Nonomuraea sp. NPDC004354]